MDSSLRDAFVANERHQHHLSAMNCLFRNRNYSQRDKIDSASIQTQMTTTNAATIAMNHQSQKLQTRSRALIRCSVYSECIYAVIYMLLRDVVHACVFASKRVR